VDTIKYSQIIQNSNEELKIDNHILLDQNSNLLFYKVIFDVAFLINNKGISKLIKNNEQQYFTNINNFRNLTSEVILDDDNIAIDRIEAVSFRECKFVGLGSEPIIGSDNIKWMNFNDCKFQSNIKQIFVRYSKSIEEIEFVTCDFQRIAFPESTKENKFIDFNLYGGSIDSLDISNQNIYNKLYLNKQSWQNNEELEIQNLTICNSKFYENFKLHNSKVKNISLVDTDFEKQCDFYKTHFSQGENHDIEDKAIYFTALNIKGLALFGSCTFEEKIYFNYITFEDVSHFKNTTFNKGLDLENTNIKNEINFYAIEIIDKQNTSQETYRTIKHHFEKLGNVIEANKYFALELEQKRQNLKKEEGNWKERWVFNLHNLSSKHSTDWFRALCLICSVGLITVGIVNFEIIIKIVFHPSLFKSDYLLNFMIEFFQYLSIININDKLKDNPFAFIINKVLLGYLYYQFIISVRKDTKR
jgi:hypothetical protein